MCVRANKPTNAITTNIDSLRRLVNALLTFLLVWVTMLPFICKLLCPIQGCCGFESRLSVVADGRLFASSHLVRSLTRPSVLGPPVRVGWVWSHHQSQCVKSYPPSCYLSKMGNFTFYHPIISYKMVSNIFLNF